MTSLRSQENEFITTYDFSADLGNDCNENQQVIVDHKAYLQREHAIEQICEQIL